MRFPSAIGALARAAPASAPWRAALRDDVTVEEASLILGCPPAAVRRHIAAARLISHGREGEVRLQRAAVEGLASEIFSWRRHSHDPDPYWVTGQRAADVLGVSRSRLGQLADAHHVPHVRHQDGTRLYRRRELAALKHARESRSGDA
jgi:hypothetical protein